MHHFNKPFLKYLIDFWSSKRCFQILGNLIVCQAEMLCSLSWTHTVYSFFLCCTCNQLLGRMLITPFFFFFFFFFLLLLLMPLGILVKCSLQTFWNPVVPNFGFTSVILSAAKFSQISSFGHCSLSTRSLLLAFTGTRNEEYISWPLV